MVGPCETYRECRAAMCEAANMERKKPAIARSRGRVPAHCRFAARAVGMKHELRSLCFAHELPMKYRCLPPLHS
jgi:hypothetical protein